jgi:hypothetical protein
MNKAHGPRSVGFLFPYCFQPPVIHLLQSIDTSPKRKRGKRRIPRLRFELGC